MYLIVLGGNYRAKVKQTSPRITASNIQGLEALVRDIVRDELAVEFGGVTSLREEGEALRHKCSELDEELATVKTERDNYAATVDELIKDHKRSSQQALTPSECSSILKALGVGKQSPTYKRVKAELDKLMLWNDKAPGIWPGATLSHQLYYFKPFPIKALNPSVPCSLRIFE